MTAALDRKAVYDNILRGVTSGRTDAEIQFNLGMKGNTQRPRRLELVEVGLVIDSGMRRETPKGNNAIVWLAVGGNDADPTQYVIKRKESKDARIARLERLLKEARPFICYDDSMGWEACDECDELIKAIDKEIK